MDAKAMDKGSISRMKRKPTVLQDFGLGLANWDYMHNHVEHNNPVP